MVATSDCAVKSKPVAEKKASKPLMEKKRRARINKCLDQLKYLLENYYTSNIRKRKLEKADILELTVRHLRSLQKIKSSSAVVGSEFSDYQAGFRSCLASVNEYLLLADNSNGRDSLILSHLSQNLRLAQGPQGSASSTTDSDSSRSVMLDAATLRLFASTAGHDTTSGPILFPSTAGHDTTSGLRLLPSTAGHDTTSGLRLLPSTAGHDTTSGPRLFPSTAGHDTTSGLRLLPSTAGHDTTNGLRLLPSTAGHDTTNAPLARCFRALPQSQSTDQGSHPLSSDSKRLSSGIKHVFSAAPTHTTRVKTSSSAGYIKCHSVKESSSDVGGISIVWRPW